MELRCFFTALYYVTFWSFEPRSRCCFVECTPVNFLDSESVRCRYLIQYVLASAMRNVKAALIRGCALRGGGEENATAAECEPLIPSRSRISRHHHGIEPRRSRGSCPGRRRRRRRRRRRARPCGRSSLWPPRRSDWQTFQRNACQWSHRRSMKRCTNIWVPNSSLNYVRL